jgi:hypothetical protein
LWVRIPPAALYTNRSSVGSNPTAPIYFHMTDYTATPDTWNAALKYAQSERAPSALPATICVLELRSHVEALEAALDRLRVDHLRLANAAAGLAPDRVKFFSSLLPERDVDTDVGAAEAAGIAKPTSNLNQIRSFLVERLRDVIASEHDPADYCWDEARAALREVAAWIRENYVSFQAIALVLEKEAEQ